MENPQVINLIAALELVTEDTLAEMRGVSKSTLQRERSEGKGPVPVRLGRTVFYRMDDVREWINRQRDGGAA